MKIKNKIISILLVIITILNILNISYASQENSIIGSENQQEDLKNNNELQNSGNNLNEEANLENLNEQEKNENVEDEKNAENTKGEVLGNKEVEEKNEIVQKETIEQNSDIVETVDESQLNIINVNEEGRPIAGNKYTVLKNDGLNSELVPYKRDLTTDSEGKINVTLFVGKFYVQQTHAVDGYVVNKSLIELNFETGENITLTIKSQKPTFQETNKTLDKQINYTEKNNNVVQNNITNNSDIVVTNNNKDIINETNTTKWNNVNNFINTIDRTNLLNLVKETLYSNNTQESNSDENVDKFNKVATCMTTSDFMKYMDRIMSSSGVPILPVASK